MTAWRGLGLSGLLAVVLHVWLLAQAVDPTPTTRTETPRTASAPVRVAWTATRAPQPAQANPATATPNRASAPVNRGASAAAAVATAPSTGEVRELPETTTAEAPKTPAPADTSTVAQTGETSVAAIPTPPVAESPVAAAPPSPGTESPPPPVKLPPNARLLYDVTGLGRGVPYRATGELLWERQGSAYSAKLEVRVLLLSRTQTSVGHLDAHGLVPERFGDKSRSERAAHFDWPGARVRFSANTPDAPLSAGTQDRLSVFLQLAGWLAALHNPPQIGQSWTIATVASRDVQPWTFRFEGTESLDLPSGPVATWRLRRASAFEHDQTVDLWFAPSLQHLPVRLRITQSNGDEVDQRLRELAWQGP